MGGSGVIDRFLGIFTQYIDSGFGLIQGDVRWLAGVLIAIDITLAGLFWTFSSDDQPLAPPTADDIALSIVPPRQPVISSDTPFITRLRP